MPYIKYEDRIQYGPALLTLLRLLKSQPKGHLTYCLSVIAKDWITQDVPNYQRISDGLAALADSEAELRRTVLNPYEDKKIQENGDI